MEPTIGIIFLCLLLLTTEQIDASRSFTIDYERNTFLKDGQPFRYISGSMHYARVHPLYWQDRLRKMYIAGLDAVQTYVPWNLHEPKHRTFNFQGGADLELFLKMAQVEGLLVILRPGPYICAEWDMGGFPSWLLKNRNIQLRTSDPAYLKYVNQWMGVLLPKIEPYLYTNGGPIIAVQIENEYGSDAACDHDYMRHLLKLFRFYLGDDVVFFTIDAAFHRNLECGSVQGALITVDFGSEMNPDPNTAFQMLRKFQPQGPLVNSEYYTGWLYYWGFPHLVRDTETIIKGLDEILKLGANVNMYMFEGGTSFGFWNGANGNETLFLPQPNTYDFDAPLSEAGDPREKYHAIRAVIGKYKMFPTGHVPPATPKYNFGQTKMHRVLTLYEAMDRMHHAESVSTEYPHDVSMEDLDQNFGFMLYSTVLTAGHMEPVTLHVPGIHDRGYVLVDKKPVGVLQRFFGDRIDITTQENSVLDILLENMGRMNYGCCLNDRKGIVSNVTLGGIVLKFWKVRSLKIEQVVDYISSSCTKVFGDTPSSGVQQVPAFYVGTLPKGPPVDTFLNMTGWSKGQAFMNGFHLGRYWPMQGPQLTLYVPGVILRATTNTLVVFETEHAPCGPTRPSDLCMVEFVDTHILNATTPYP